MSFPKGKPRPANSGRRKGTPKRGTERARRLIADADDKAIVERVILGAKAGEAETLRVYFRYAPTHAAVSQSDRLYAAAIARRGAGGVPQSRRAPDAGRDSA